MQKCFFSVPFKRMRSRYDSFELRQVVGNQTHSVRFREGLKMFQMNKNNIELFFLLLKSLFVLNSSFTYIFFGKNSSNNKKIDLKKYCCQTIRIFFYSVNSI